MLRWWLMLRKKKRRSFIELKARQKISRGYGQHGRRSFIELKDNNRQNSKDKESNM